MSTRTTTSRRGRARRIELTFFIPLLACDSSGGLTAFFFGVFLGGGGPPSESDDMTRVVEDPKVPAKERAEESGGR